MNNQEIINEAKQILTEAAEHYARVKKGWITGNPLYGHTHKLENLLLQSLAQKDKEREEVVREIIEELERWKGDGLIGTRGDLYPDFAQQLREKYAIKKD